MSFRSSDRQATTTELHLPTDVHWDMLDKSKFFVLGAALFSGVSATLYPVMVLKTRQQVSCLAPSSSFTLCGHILRCEGVRGLYRGFATSLLGTIPARLLYMSTLEVTKSVAGGAALTCGLSASAAATASNAVGGLAASVAAQLVWTPVDVISQRLMVQGDEAGKTSCRTEIHGSGPRKHTDSWKAAVNNRFRSSNYRGGVDAFRCIVQADGWQGLYRGFGMSVLTYAPSNALWWASYCLTQRTFWSSLAYCGDTSGECTAAPSPRLVIGVQSASAACAGGVTALLTTPLDTIKTRLQVEKQQLSARETVGKLIEEGGWRACYKGFGPRWSMMAMSAVTMISTYEFLKRMSKKQDV